jgi:predicted phage terminase large subunit-like protein
MAADETGPIRPQDGPQLAFLASQADIAIYGGAAGGGKTWALLMEPLRHKDVHDFGCVFFRRTTVQIRNEGGLWDESGKLYRHAGAKPKEHVLEWRFPSGAAISFAHLEYDKNVHDYQGAQIPLICFDELTHFSEQQFWYLLSRNRSMCGVRPYVRATCNPDVDSWVAKFIAWWIDPETGYSIPERCGLLRWFVRVGDKLIWASDPAELAAHVSPNTGKPIPPKSVTFIAAKLSDNRKLMDADPAYEANLLALPLVDRERLLGGNWKIRAASGLLFKRAWCKIIDVLPADLEIIRGWDLAATPKTATNDPDSTSSTKIGRTPGGRYVVMHNTNIMEGPAGVETHLVNMASQDGVATVQSLPQDPGGAGKVVVAGYSKALAGYNVRSSPENGDKVIRFGPFSAQAEHSNVDVLRGEWNEAWFSALEAFPPQDKRGHDDDADSTSRAFNAFLKPIRGAWFLEKARLFNAEHQLESTQFFKEAPYYAPGSMEWAAQQKAAKDRKDADDRLAAESAAAVEQAAAEQLAAAAARSPLPAPEFQPGSMEWANRQAALAANAVALR